MVHIRNGIRINFAEKRFFFHLRLRKKVDFLKNLVCDEQLFSSD